MFLGFVSGGGDEMGAFEYGCRHGHANYNLRVLGQMRGLGTDVWVFFSSFFYNSESGSGDCFMGFVY